MEIIAIIFIVIAIINATAKSRKLAQEQTKENVPTREYSSESNDYEVTKKTMERTKQRIKSAMQEKKTILQRAIENTDEQKEDITLNTMEQEHNHSERVSEAIHHHEEDIIPENLLGNIDDLMIKGYEGNLCFDRDFVGEAMDMIGRFTAPSEIPDFSISEKVS